MPTFDEAVAQLRGAEAAGFGFSEAQGSKLINQAVRHFASRSEWIRAELELGPTVADQEVYELPSNVVKALRLQVGSAPYSRQNLETIWDLRSGRKWLSGDGGVFAPRFDETGTERNIGLFPVPDTASAGAAITCLAAIFPLRDLSGNDPIPFPESHWRGVLYEAKAIAYEDIDENPNQASYNRELAGTEAEVLRRLANSQVGGGPVSFPVAGH